MRDRPDYICVINKSVGRGTITIWELEHLAALAAAYINEQQLTPSEMAAAWRCI
jgi:hypothetical protein